MTRLQVLVFIVFGLLSSLTVASTVKVKDITRFDGVRDNALVGYGIVVGLSGSGDSLRSTSTLQSIRNTLENFDIIVSTSDIKSRNVAAVMITASLPAFAQAGDKMDVVVSSIGDAKSLTGGTLLLAPLKAANDQIYALAQGPVSVGGYQFEANENVVQKNHPTVGRILAGANIEKSINNRYYQDNGAVHLILNQPDFTTIDLITKALGRRFSQLQILPLHAGRIEITNGNEFVPIGLISKIENTLVETVTVATVVINERTGTIVAGTDIQVSDVVISHGSLKLVINTDFGVSQPSGLVGKIPSSIRTEVVRDTEISVSEELDATYINESGTNIADLVQSLKQLNLNTRDIIAILQALKQSGALHAKLVVQ